MAEPFHDPDSAIGRLLERVCPGRFDAIANDRCIPAPIGCGKPAPPSSFSSDRYRAEYAQSGLCETCQRAFFPFHAEFVHGDSLDIPPGAAPDDRTPPLQPPPGP